MRIHKKKYLQCTEHPTCKDVFLCQTEPISQALLPHKADSQYASLQCLVCNSLNKYYSLLHIREEEQGRSFVHVVTPAKQSRSIKLGHFYIHMNIQYRRISTRHANALHIHRCIDRQSWPPTYTTEQSDLNRWILFLPYNTPPNQ